MPKVLIVDDQAIVRHGLRSFLQDEGAAYVVGLATSGEQAMALCRAEAWDVVLLDFWMPGEGGLVVLDALHCEFPGLPVLMLSFIPEHATVMQCLNAGAVGFVAKEELSDQVIPAIAAALSGQPFLSPAAKMALEHIDA
jgi:two-component system, NarL family, invasion response regulator UvrY